MTLSIQTYISMSKLKHIIYSQFKIEMCLAELILFLMEANHTPILVHKQLFSSGPMYTMMRDDNIFRGQFSVFCKASSNKEPGESNGDRKNSRNYKPCGQIFRRVIFALLWESVERMSGIPEGQRSSKQLAGLLG